MKSIRVSASPNGVFGLAIHGGAGAPLESITPEIERQYRAKLRESLDAGYAALERHGSAMDAVIAAIVVLEDAGLFDAGRGSVLNAEGFCELDACVMDGRTLAAGAIAGVQHIRNPIRLARAILEDGRHVLLLAEGAEKFAQSAGFDMVPNSYFFTDSRVTQWKELGGAGNSKAAASGVSTRASDAAGTVGAVALDKDGNLAAGTSTGGVFNKMPGRVGDSPIIGAGTYANNGSCAVSGTGQGEFFIRSVLAHNIAALINYRGLPIEQAAQAALNEVQELGGEGGCIAMDCAGNVALPFNTAVMSRGLKMSDGRDAVELFPSKEE